MRVYGLALAALVLLTSLLGRAQQPPAKPPAAPPAAPPAEDKVLDGYLRNWERAMKDVTTLAADPIVRIDKDRTFETVQKFTGEAYYMKAGTGPTALNLAILEMRLEGKKRGDFQEKFICTGTFLYQFLPDRKEIKAYELPKPKPGQVAEDNFLSFLFGMKAEEAKRRYNLKLAKEDKFYIFVDIAPRFAADRSDFQRARLVLNKGNFLPRQLWFEHANGNEVTWDIPTLRSDVKLNRQAFDAPQAPPGWKIVPVSRETQTQPRIIRPSGK